MSQSFVKRPDNGPHSALAGLGVLRTERAPTDPLDVLRRIVAWRDNVYAGRMVRSADLEALIEEARALLPDGVQGTSPPSIPATWQHDAGAYARCSFCLRYTRNPKALSHSSCLCDCGSADGWSGSFAKPGPDARWLASDGVEGTS